ncbi:MAG: T9SS type A sorting domain-containing protein [Bacteroidetes bacterium]|nr:T9SS type A sorting domain-containing protein [Bacteroidota bacterium]
MKEKILTIYSIILLGITYTNAQSLGRVGSPNDTVTTCTAGTVLMGGGADVDAAFTWMITKSGGGDFVVIRATGTNAYNSYIYGLGPANSVETFLVNSKTKANDSVIVQAIRKAEAIFFAGGDQNDYITFYKGTALGKVIDYLANVKHAPIGGTSAGMAIQGYIYYDGITNVLSSEALLNPYASGTGIHYNDFLHNPFLKKTICDTHFSTKGGTTSNGITGRQGRLMSFLARMITDSTLSDGKGIACDEKTAVCIDENGIGMVIGVNKAYFLRQWCAAPETCVSGLPLTWTNGAKVYIIKGPGNYTTLPDRSKSVNLSDWITVSGGTYNYWTVNNGLLTIGQTTGTPVICNPYAIDEINSVSRVQIFPNPTPDFVYITLQQPSENSTVKLVSITGQIFYERTNLAGNQFRLDISSLMNGLYIIEIIHDGNVLRSKIVKQ